MKQVKNILQRILYPGAMLAVLLTIISTVALVFIFISERQETLEAYIIYTLTVYSLVVLVLVVPKITTTIKTFINGNKISSRYMNDMPYRVKVSLYSALFFNLLYAVFKLLAGIHYASFWYGADAVYYIVLSAIRFLLLRNVRNEGCDLEKEFKQYRTCGILLFVLNATLTGVVFQMVNQGMGYQYPGLLIYAVATYAFFCLTLAIINLGAAWK